MRGASTYWGWRTRLGCSPCFLRLVPGGGLEFCSCRHRARRRLAGGRISLIIAGDYGESGVFRILDPFLTARLPAEALIITALACHFRGKKGLGLLLALGALLSIR